MGSSFNPQILVAKLSKLKNSQASIDTLSHWCIFYMNKAKQIVETWDRQFHCSPREQRLALLYLANDILQNSRRKGSEFVGEFWKVLPAALRDVIERGDEFGRNAALRLISIWEERKVFGTRGKILKEELVGRQQVNNNRNGRHVEFNLKHPVGSTMDKLVSGYQVVYGSQMDEDDIFSKCRNAISCIERVDKEIGINVNSGQFHGPAHVEKIQSQHAILRECIDQLTAVESSRASLVSHLREALREQEIKLEQVRTQLQAAQSQSEQASNICRQLLNCDNPQLVAEQSSKESHSSIVTQFQPYIPSQSPLQASFPQFSHSESHRQNVMTTTNTKQLTSNEVPPPPPSSSPPLLPMAHYSVPQYMPTAGSVNAVPYSYGLAKSRQPSLPSGYSAAGSTMIGISPFTTPLTNSYQSFQGSDGFYKQPSSGPTGPISRQ